MGVWVYTYTHNTQTTKVWSRWAVGWCQLFLFQIMKVCFSLWSHRPGLWHCILFFDHIHVWIYNNGMISLLWTNIVLIQIMSFLYSVMFPWWAPTSHGSVTEWPLSFRCFYDERIIELWKTNICKETQGNKKRQKRRILNSKAVISK